MLLFQHDGAGEYFPAQALPADTFLVVRIAALRHLELVSEPKGNTEKPLNPRERESLLLIIAGLAKLARIDIDKPSAAAAAIETQTELMGVRVAARTIENHLKRIREAVENKAED